MATWTRWGEILVNADASNQRVFQRFTPPSDMILDRLRAELEIVADPTLTSVHFKLYSSRAGVPGLLLATSTARTKAELMPASLGFGALVNGRVESYWDFLTRPTLRGGTEYTLVLNGAGWTFTDSSHLRWNKAWPEDPYGPDTTKDIQTGSFVFRPIGSEL